MKFKEFLPEEKVRLDPKCWTGKKIGNPKTKMKGGVRVNNCVPAESVDQGVAEAQLNELFDMQQEYFKLADGTPIQVDFRQAGLNADAMPGSITITPVNPKIMPMSGMQSIKPWDKARQNIRMAIQKWVQSGQQGVAEGRVDYNFDIEDLKRLERIRDLATLKAQALALISKPSAKPMKPEKVEWFKNALERMNSPMKVIKLMYDLLLSGEGNAVVGTRSSMNPNSYRQRFGEQAMPDNFNGEYDDEAGMADNNLETLDRAVEGIDRLIDSGDNLPEWCQEKIAVAKSMLVAVWDYMYSEEASDEVDPEVDEMFEAMDQLAEEMAAKNGVSADLVWEQFEALPDNVLYETAAWRRKEGKSKKGGLNAKGVASYRRENPGSKLQMAVTTKPSKLKKGSKAAKRRKSFCARMGGVKGPMKKPNGKPTRKALALRKWNC
jgi:hypothetical protein